MDAVRYSLLDAALTQCMWPACRSREEQIQSFEKETQNRRKKLEVEKLRFKRMRKRVKKGISTRF